MKKVLCVLLLIITINLTACSSTAVLDQDKNVDYKQKYQELLKDQAPFIKDITFKTMDGKTIEKEANWYTLDKQVKVIITLTGNCTSVELFKVPSGSETYKQQQLIEGIPVNQDVVEFVWNVPNDIHDHFFIIAYNKDVGRKSSLYNIVSRNK